MGWLEGRKFAEGYLCDPKMKGKQQTVVCYRAENKTGGVVLKKREI